MNNKSIPFEDKSLDSLKNEIKTLKEENKELKNAYLESIELLRHTVEAKDSYTRGHSDRVAEFALLIGKHLGLSKKDLNTLKIGALFHDIGKIGISDSIILKDGKLTDEEYIEVRRHPLIGKQILSNSTVFKDMVPIVYYHHEKYDGTGYPEGLKGEEIPYLTRITTVADTFDAMTTNRSYRNALPLEAARNEIEKYSGIQFDPEITKVFLEIFDNNFDEILEIRNKY